jgi:hypothetical protein
VERVLVAQFCESARATSTRADLGNLFHNASELFVDEFRKMSEGQASNNKVLFLGLKPVIADINKHCIALLSYTDELENGKMCDEEVFRSFAFHIEHAKENLLEYIQGYATERLCVLYTGIFSCDLLFIFLLRGPPPPPALTCRRHAIGTVFAHGPLSVAFQRAFRLTNGIANSRQAGTFVTPKLFLQPIRMTIRTLFIFIFIFVFFFSSF